MIKFIRTKLCKCGRKIMVKLNSDGSFFTMSYFTDKEKCGTCFTYGIKESQRQLGELEEQLSQ